MYTQVDVCQQDFDDANFPGVYSMYSSECYPVDFLQLWMTVTCTSVTMWPMANNTGCIVGSPTAVTVHASAEAALCFVLEKEVLLSLEGSPCPSNSCSAGMVDIHGVGCMKTVYVALVSVAFLGVVVAVSAVFGVRYARRRRRLADAPTCDLTDVTAEQRGAGDVLRPLVPSSSAAAPRQAGYHACSSYS